MARLDYIYETIVARGALESLMLSKTKKSSLQDHVKTVLTFTFGLHEDFFPDDLKEHWHTIKSVYAHPVKPKFTNQPIDPVDRRIRSLSTKEAEAVVRAFLTITVEVVKRLEPSSKWKRIKHSGN